MFGTRSKNVASHTRTSVAVELAALETRRLMSASHGTHRGPELEINENFVLANLTAGTSASVSTAAAASPLSAIPALSSRPSAAAKIYLDFDGDTTSTWGQYRPGTTPGYDTDGDATTFSDGELAGIREVFTRVAEKFSPFNIDVTTVNPGTFANRGAIKVVVGGDGAWLGSQAGGVAFINAFTNSASNTAWVFPKMLGNGYAKYVAEAAAHEAGHTFGLQHQSKYDAAGNVVAAYDGPNAAGDAPVMGNSYNARRGIWRYGTNAVSSTTYQDDMAVLSNTNNAFGYRADDFGSTLPTSAALTLDGTAAYAKGVVEKTTDLDVFSFTTGAGVVNFTLAPEAVGGMLDAKLDLRDATGAVVASADAGLSESLSATLAAGTYYVTVGSHGGYGDVGQYTLTGAVVSPLAQPPVTLEPQPTAPAAPTNLAARQLTTSSVRLSWTDASADETGFRVYASRDNKTWTVLGTVGANVTGVDHTGLKRNTTYYYKVRSFNAVGESADSNVASSRTALTAQTAAKGDANLDGVVDFDDLLRLSQNYNAADGKAWGDGDFNGDGAVNFDDLLLLSQGYNTGTPLSADVPADDSDWGTLTPVNETTAPAVVTTTATAPTATTTSKSKQVGNAKPAKPVFSVKPVFAKHVPTRR